MYQANNIPSKNKIHNEKHKVIFPVLLMLILLLVSADSILFGTNANEVTKNIRNYMPVALILYFTFRICVRRIPLASYVLVSVLIVFCMAINFVIAPGNNSLNNYISQMMLVMIGVLVVINYSFQSFCEIFEKIMFVFAIGSIFVYILALIVPNFIRMFPPITNTANLEYRWVLVSAVSEYGMVFNDWLRNTGLFREPGVYQMFLNLALVFHLFRDKKVKVLNVLIFAIAIITTTSTTGLLAITLVVFAFVLSRNQRGKKAPVIWGMLAMAIIVTGMLYFGVSSKLTYAINKVFDSTNPSTSARIGSISANLDMWFDYPIFGIGAAEANNQFSSRVMEVAGVYNIDNTNTVLSIFACYGMFVGLMFSIGTWLVCLKIGKSKAVVLVLFIFMLTIYSGENLWYSYFPYILMMYGFQYTDKRRENTRFTRNNNYLRNGGMIK